MPKSGKRGRLLEIGLWLPSGRRGGPGDGSVVRGEPGRAAGRIVAPAEGLGVPGRRVELYVRPKSLGGGYFLGSTVTLADGSFEISADLPREAPLGEHEVLAFTPGDSKFGSSSTQ